MSQANRGRAGKFSKPKRGGGKHFSRDLEPLNAEGEVMGMWGDEKPKQLSDAAEESSSEESSDDDGQPAQDLTREERRAQAKARKQAAIERQNKKVAEPGDLPTDSSSSEEEDDDDADMPANPNHTAKARNQAAKAPVGAAPDGEPEKTKGAKPKDPSQLSRREREALQAQQQKEKYEKLHAEGKTDQARSDLDRLALVRERREQEAARKKAETEERAEAEKSKSEQMDREAKRRENALGGKRGGRGGKKKA